MRLCSHASKWSLSPSYSGVSGSFSDLGAVETGGKGGETTEGGWLVCIDWNNAANACKVGRSSMGAVDDVASDEVGVSVEALSTRCCKASIWLRIS